MATQAEVATSIARIQYMETLFEQLSRAYESLSVSALKAPTMQEALQTLRDYYTNGEWMHDYELDEAGMIPKSLKRGVLSEDGLYHLLCDVADAGD